MFLTLFNVIFQTRQYSMSGTLIHHIKQRKHILKLSLGLFIICNVFNIAWCINMDSFVVISKAFTLNSICIVLCLQDKAFVKRVQKHVISTNCRGKYTENLTALLWFFFPIIYLRYFSVKILYNVRFILSIHVISVKFILSLFLTFLNTEYLRFSFLQRICIKYFIRIILL